MGGVGFTKDYPVEKYYRDCKIGKSRRRLVDQADEFKPKIRAEDDKQHYSGELASSSLVLLNSMNYFMPNCSDVTHSDQQLSSLDAGHS